MRAVVTGQGWLRILDTLDDAITYVREKWGANVDHDKANNRHHVSCPVCHKPIAIIEEEPTS